jgi:succinate dehydrogenase flavin-adding protein (antitoxin of CptAB toxin-antitoxin module)
MTNIQNRLKKLKYRCQTLGIKELDVTFSKIFQNVESTQNINHITLLEELVQNETQQILDIFFHPEAKDLRSKYQLIINLSK